MKKANPVPEQMDAFPHPFVRKCNNYDRDAASVEAGTRITDPSMTHQNFKDDCDINTIVKRFGVTGQLPQVSAPQYGDFTGVEDYRTALHAVMEAEDRFMMLPATVRERFHNNPQELLEFCADRSNIEEAKKLGLVLDIPNNDAKLPPKSQDSPAA